VIRQVHRRAAAPADLGEDSVAGDHGPWRRNEAHGEAF
jgi:hypothetical protein